MNSSFVQFSSSMMIQRNDVLKIRIFYDLVNELHVYYYILDFFFFSLFCELWFSLRYIIYLVVL